MGRDPSEGARSGLGAAGSHSQSPANVKAVSDNSSDKGRGLALGGIVVLRGPIAEAERRRQPAGDDRRIGP